MDCRIRTRAHRSLGAIAALAAAAGASAAPPAVDVFFKDYAYDTVVISPGGRYLAVTYPSNGTTNAAVIDMQDMKAAALTGYAYPQGVEWIRWKSDEALIYGMTKLDPKSGLRIDNIASVQRDGSRHIFLLDNELPEGAVNWRYLVDEVVDLLPEEPDVVLLSSDGERADYPSAYRVSTRTAGSTMRGRMQGLRFATTRRSVVGSPPGRKCSYLADRKATVRVCTTMELDASRRMLYRAGPDTPWEELEHFPDDSSRMIPVGFTEDDLALVVLSNVERDNYALYVYEPAKRALAELVFEAPGGLDLDEVVHDTYDRSIVAARYHDHGTHTVFFDTLTARAHTALQKLFADSAVTIASRSRDGKKAVVLVTSNNEPGTYYLFDHDGQKVSELVRRAPWLKDAKFGVKKAIEFQARDRTPISGYLTYPAGREPRNLPMIINPHGGPFGIRQIGGFDSEAEFFASRGYAVLQINFRGSGGYGSTFRSAGHREWGRKMQDDITDGVQWAIAEGIADKNRIAIYGASYGGYAAMMGLVRTPELFRCGITFAGVSDLAMLLNTRRVTTGRAYADVPKEVRKYWEDVVGDRKDEAGLRAASPRFNVASIRVPVLIAHGEEDFTVPVEHATLLRDALREAGKPVEYLGVHNEGHGFRDAANRVELYTRIEKFLAQHLPADAPAAPTP